MSGLARFGALGHSGLSPDAVIATQEGEVILDRPPIREPDLGVRAGNGSPDEAFSRSLTSETPLGKRSVVRLTRVSAATRDSRQERAITGSSASWWAECSCAR